jgi:hypothetical protein
MSLNSLSFKNNDALNKAGTTTSIISIIRIIIA